MPIFRPFFFLRSHKSAASALDLHHRHDFLEPRLLHHFRVLVLVLLLKLEADPPGEVALLVVGLVFVLAQAAPVVSQVVRELKMGQEVEK